jgi:hypothetical protein
MPLDGISRRHQESGSPTDPIHLVLVRREATGDVAVVGSHFLDWRVLLLKTHVWINLFILKFII